LVGWDVDPTVAGWVGLPSLDSDISADACVVGLGGSGLAAVDALAERGLSVIGVDAGRIAAGAAGRNGGFLLGGGAPALHRAIAGWGEGPAVELYRATLAELDRLVADLGPELIRRTGSIRLAGLPPSAMPPDEAEEADRVAELADCVEQADALRRHAIRVEPYRGELGEGLFLPDDAVTNPARRVLASATSVLRAHPAVRLYEHTPVMAIAPGRVETARARISAGLVIVAVDGGLDRLVPELAGLVRTARLQMLATEPVPPRLPCPVYGRWGYDYAQQDGSGAIFAGGGRDRFAAGEWTSDGEPTAPVQVWIEEVATRMAGAPVRVTHRWAASVGFSEDGRPLCVEVAPGVIACGGYSGTGNLVGPATVRAAVGWALDRRPPPAWCRTSV
jgi:glycine/D-amino acid oxidase-like deaminating enzyme